MSQNGQLVAKRYELQCLELTGTKLKDDARRHAWKCDVTVDRGMTLPGKTKSALILRIACTQSQVAIAVIRRTRPGR